MSNVLTRNAAIAAALLCSTALSANANGEMKAIGETTALIAEAGLATAPIADGQSANTDFPFANFKAIATVGEIDKSNGLALTGYPDG